MLVKYWAPRFVREGGINPTQLGDVKYGSFLALDYYINIRKVECYLEHEDSIEEQLVELVHALAKKMRDVRWSYWKRIRQLSLKLDICRAWYYMSESALNTILIPLNLKPTNKNGRKIMQVLCLFKDNWIKNSMRFNRSWKRPKRRRRKQGRLWRLCNRTSRL
jgi:hypothetical protein